MELTVHLLASIIRRSEQQVPANDSKVLAQFILNELRSTLRTASRNLEEAKFHDAAVRAMRLGIGSAQLQVLLNDATINEVDYSRCGSVVSVSLTTEES